MVIQTTQDCFKSCSGLFQYVSELVKYFTYPSNREYFFFFLCERQAPLGVASLRFPSILLSFPMYSPGPRAPPISPGPAPDSPQPRDIPRYPPIPPRPPKKLHILLGNLYILFIFFRISIPIPFVLFICPVSI